MRQHRPCLAIQEPVTQETHRGAPSSGPKDTTKPMTLHVALTHETTYRYDRLIGMGPQIDPAAARPPQPHPHSQLLADARTQRSTSSTGSRIPSAISSPASSCRNRHESFSVKVDLVADMAVINPFDFFVEEEREALGRSPTTRPCRKELQPYLEPAAGRPAADRLPRGHRAEIESHDRLPLRPQPAAVQTDIQYLIRMEPGVQTPEETLEGRLGSCRDSGWLLVQILRSLGLAARFVSGYLIQLKPDVKSLDGPTGTDVDFTDLHAWAEVYIPGAGWIGLDPTSGLLAGEGHIPLAATPNPSSAAPISGAHEQGRGRRSPST